MSNTSWLRTLPLTAIPNLKSPIPKIVTTISDNHNRRTFCDVRDAISTIAGIENLEEITASKAEQHFSEKVRLKKRNVRTFLGTGWTLSATSAVIFVKSWGSELQIGPHYYFTPMIVAAWAFLKTEAIRNKQQGNELENLTNPRVREALSLLQRRLPKLYGRDIEGQFFQYSNNIWFADNWIDFLLAEPDSRPHIFLEGKFLSGPIFIKQEVVDEIVEACRPLSNIPIIEDNNTPSEQARENQKRSISKKRKKKSYKNAIELECILTNELMARSFDLVILQLSARKGLPKEVAITVPRKRWHHFIALILTDFEAWMYIKSGQIDEATHLQDVKTRANDLEQQIITTLDISDANNSNMYSDIKKGKYRRWINWLWAIENYTKTNPVGFAPLDFSDQRISLLPAAITQIELDL